MTTVTIIRNDKKVTLPVYYSIFDMDNSILDDNFDVDAVSTKDALKKYNPDLKVRRDSSKFASICVTKFFSEDGRRYKVGNRSWYIKV